MYYFFIFSDYLDLDTFSAFGHNWSEDGVTNIIHQPDLIIFNISSSKSDSVDEEKSRYLTVVWEFNFENQIFTTPHTGCWRWRTGDFMILKLFSKLFLQSFNLWRQRVQTQPWGCDLEHRYEFCLVKTGVAPDIRWSVWSRDGVP